VQADGQKQRIYSPGTTTQLQQDKGPQFVLFGQLSEQWEQFEKL
jgi:hypothetical protein